MTILSVVLGMIIRRSDKDFFERPLSNTITELGPINSNQCLWTTCLTSLLWSRKWFPLVFFPHLELHYYSH